MQTIKCLSIPQPYAWATICNGRLIHSMHAHTAFRGRLAIHASQSVDSLITRLDDGTRVPANLDFGCIIGAVTVVDCVRPDHPSVIGSHWAHGPWCLVLDEPKALTVPVRAVGKPGLFDVDVQRIQLAQQPAKPLENKPKSLFENLYA